VPPLRRFLNYGLAAAGPVGTAGSQFVLSIQLLHVLPPDSFGAFSFLLVTAQFCTGLWSALFCAPLPVLMTEQPGAEGRARVLRCLFSTNLALAAVAFLVFVGLGVGVGVPLAAALLFAGYAGTTLVRGFGRAYAYAVGTPLRTTASDLVYSATLLAGIVALALSGATSLTLAYGALFAGAVLGLLPFGLRYLAAQFLEVGPRHMPPYGDVWRRHAGWALTGVVTTEATVNAHAYIVTAVAGPAAFAPVAASALIIRPVGVVMNALTDFERPQMARQIGEGRIAEARHAVHVFRAVMVATWVGTAAAGGALLVFAPHLLFPPQYARETLELGAALWLAVAALRLVRNPESVLLQAAGWFRRLATASFLSSAVSVAAVALLLALAGPIWSVAGVFVGEATFAAWLWREALRWRRLAPGLQRARAEAAEAAKAAPAAVGLEASGTGG
jgi:hypothetical protein